MFRCDTINNGDGNDNDDVVSIVIIVRVIEVTIDIVVDYITIDISVNDVVTDTGDVVQPMI